MFFFCVIWLQRFRLAHCFFLLIQYKNLLVRNGKRVVTSQKFIYLIMNLVELIFWVFYIYVCLLFIANYSHKPHCIFKMNPLNDFNLILSLLLDYIITRLLNMLILIKEMFRTVVYLEYKRIFYHWLMLSIE